MIYGSVCSGIEAASVAWHPLGWRPRWFAVIAAFPSAVLAARWPDVPNLGDFTAIGSTHGPVDVLVGGTPCQSFSVAGGRAGLDDPRGVLALEFLRLAIRVRARWIVWENVPGALSSGNGRDIRDVLGSFVDAGYGVAWRVLDAQRFGVPQRRRRLFAIGYLGDWRPPVAVLFERPSVRGNPATSGDPRSTSAGGSRIRPQNVVDDFGGPDVIVDRIANALTTRSMRYSSEDTFVIQDATRGRRGIQNGIGISPPGSPSFTLATRSTHAIAFHTTQDPINGSVSPCLSAEPGHVGVLTFDEVQITHRENRTRPIPDAPSPTPATSGGRVTAIGPSMRPRRLTPREWERLQGFPDDYTAIEFKGKPALDGPRYEAIGNSMAVPVMRWIAERIAFVDPMVDFG